MADCEHKIRRKFLNKGVYDLFLFGVLLVEDKVIEAWRIVLVLGVDIGVVTEWTDHT